MTVPRHLSPAFRFASVLVIPLGALLLMPAPRAGADSSTGASSSKDANSLAEVDPSSPSLPESFLESTVEALSILGLGPEDTRQPIDPSLQDPFRLVWIDRLLAEPLTVVGDVRSITDGVGDLGSIVATAWKILERTDPEATTGEATAQHREDASNLVDRLRAAGAPKSQVELVESLFLACSAALEGGLWADRPFLEKMVEQLDLDESVEEKGPVELRQEEREAMAEDDAFYARAEQIPVRARLEGHGSLFETVAAIVARATDSDFVSKCADWVPFHWDSPHGAVVVGSTGPDRHPGGALLLIDPGGNDLYPDGAGGTGVGARPVSVYLDLSGDDVYEDDGPGSVAAGVGGCGILVDMRGDDTYRASAFGLGAGAAGIGALFDGAGHDLYDGVRVGQGAGVLGVGLLTDRGGSDVYRLSAYGHGFGGVAGLGVLHDVAGGDRYLSMPVSTDILRHADHHISFLQGAAYGARPDRSGGVGLLVDDAGNDLYQCDVFGQGVAYWFGLGAVVDRSGDDVYTAYTYTQGSGVHLAIGLLLDESGEDVYSAEGVSQGCGHDLAAGILLDAAGEDSYVCFGLSQGAGNANGCGLLCDLAGRDLYSQRNPDRAAGYGNPRRGNGSIGLLVDASGQDAYTHQGGDGTVWWGSTIGAGLDSPRDLEASAGTDIPAVALSDTTFTDEELFILATTGPPKFRELRDFARRSLARKGAEAFPVYRRWMGTRIARERHGLKDLLKMIGDSSVPFLASILDGDRKASGSPEERSRARSQAAWCLGEVGSPRGTPHLVPVLHETKPSMRSQAAMALGRIARADSSSIDLEVASSLAGLLASDPDPNVRRAAAWALGRLKTSRWADALAVGLDDDFFGVRLATADGLVALGDDAVPVAAARAERDHGGWGRTWALYTLERLASRSAAEALTGNGLAEGSRSWSDDERLAYTKALAKQPESESVDHRLWELSGDEDWRVASVARSTLRER